MATATAHSIFADARQIYAQAIDRFEAGDVRDAAEKAWCATLRATDALIVARTGQEPEKSPATTRALNELLDADQSVSILIGRFYSRQGQLHGECFYLGLCEPMTQTERRIRETDRCIHDAEQLAYN